MTFFNDSRLGTSATRSALSGLVDGISGFFSGLVDSFRRYRKFTETQDELNRLTKRELEDLGITRSMITRVAMEAAYKD